MQPWLQLWQCRFIHFWAQKQQVGPNGKNWLASNQISDTSVLNDWVMLACMPAYKWMNVQLWKGTTYSIHIILWDSVWQKKKKKHVLSETWEQSMSDFLPDPLFADIHLNMDLPLYEVHRACLLFFSSLFISESESVFSYTWVSVQMARAR